MVAGLSSETSVFFFSTILNTWIPSPRLPHSPRCLLEPQHHFSIPGSREERRRASLFSLEEASQKSSNSILILF